MDKLQLGKKDLIILDFDGTIYHNPRQDFTINIDFNNILPANQFFSELAYQVPLFSAYNFAHNTQFLLLTGRPLRQKEIILELLSMKGYKIDLSVFSTYKYSIPEINSKYRENSFLIEYWAKKVEYINNLHNSNIFNSITIIDDDEVICTMLKNLKYTTIQAEIQHSGLDNHIKFHSFNQRANLQLLEKEVMIHT